MLGYALLENEKLPKALQNKPRWVTCMVCTVGVLIITLSAVGVGAFIGYTYCYVEHRSGFRTGNITHTTKLEIFHLPTGPEVANRTTINGALFSSVLISRLFQIGQCFKDVAIHLPSASLKSVSPVTLNNYSVKYSRK